MDCGTAGALIRRPGPRGRRAGSPARRAGATRRRRGWRRRPARTAIPSSAGVNASGRWTNDSPRASERTLEIGSDTITPDEPGEEPDQQALDEEHEQDRRVAGPDRAHHADLARPLDDVHRHRPSEPQRRRRRPAAAPSPTRTCSIVVNRVSIDARISLRVWVWATAIPARSSVSRTAVARVALDRRRPGRSVTTISSPALPRVAGQRVERRRRRVQERPLGGRLDDADQRERRRRGPWTAG